METVYHRRVHSETGQTPIQRWSTCAPVMPSVAQLREAFLWSEHRTVTKTATVNLHGNHYEVDTALVGRRVELVFDPFDLTGIQVRWQGRAMGAAIPHKIGRHVHHKARPDESTRPRHQPGSTTCVESRPSTPPNWPNGSATATCPMGTSPAS